jgi:hypothetical protein
LLVLFPIETVVFIRLDHLIDVTVRSSIVRSLVPGRVVFPSSDSALDTFVVEVGVVFLLEGGQDLLELLDPLVVRVSLTPDSDNRLSQLIDSLLRQTGQHTQLSSLGTDISLDNPALLLSLNIGMLRLELLQLVFLALDLRSQSLKAVLHFFSQPRCLDNKLSPLPSRIAQALLSDLVQPPPFLANLFALVGTFHSTNVIILLASIAAQFIVADAVVDAGKGHVSRQVALVLAVEAG